MPGNAAFSFALDHAAPGSTAVLGISSDWVSPGAAGAGIWIDLRPGPRVLPAGGAGILRTDASGEAVIPMPLPDRPSLRGTTFYAQWAVVDPAGTYAAGAGLNLAMSPARTIIIW